MNFFSASSFARGFAWAAWAAAAGPAGAQQTIQFTTPTDPDLAAKANSFMPPASARNSSASAFNAPAPLFGSRSPTAAFDVLPGSHRLNAADIANAMQWQKLLENKKNWTLMTPEEILGVRTSEEILGIPDPKNDPTLSPEERFLKRLDGRAAAAATNSFRPDAAYWHGDAAADPLHPQDAESRFAGSLGGNLPSAASPFNSVFNPNPNSAAGAYPKPEPIWANPFNQPEPLPKPTPEQLAGMDRFRALMEPPAPEKTPEAANFYGQPPVAAPDPNMQVLPAFNPAGRSFTPLESDISRPMGLAPLTGITGARPVAAKKPPLVEVPPWLSTSPLPSTPPVRQY
jgi:hypothetical protein